jgi:ribonuclease HI
VGDGHRTTGGAGGVGEQPTLFAPSPVPAPSGHRAVMRPVGSPVPPTVVAATDGSVIGNPGPAAWCWYIGPASWAVGTFDRSTNNIAELTAIEQLLRTVPGELPLQIRCDSQYAINALTVWSPGWARKGWRTASGAPVANVDLIRTITGLLAGRESPAVFAKVRAHQVTGGDPLNEAADLRANDAARCVQHGRPAATGPGYTG